MKPSITAAAFAVFALAACATPAPDTYTDSLPSAQGARDAYIKCSWDSLKPLLKSSRTDSALDVASVAEQKCSAQREAMRQALAADNGGSSYALAFANSYTENLRKRVIASMAEALMKSE